MSKATVTPQETSSQGLSHVTAMHFQGLALHFLLMRDTAESPSGSFSHLFKINNSSRVSEVNEVIATSSTFPKHIKRLEKETRAANKEQIHQQILTQKRWKSSNAKRRSMLIYLQARWGVRFAVSFCLSHSWGCTLVPSAHNSCSADICTAMGPLPISFELQLTFSG